ncbi:hypothetical protein ABVN23_20255 [Pseudomonas fluorescens]|uniref:hypothetical protein n=1 Tax=Pseudomonas fluorescens TaxID=294 RepID=UPI003F948C21
MNNYSDHSPAKRAGISQKSFPPGQSDETRGSQAHGRPTYTTLTRMLGIQVQTDSIRLDPGLEHTVLASRASLDEIHNPILLDAIIHSGCFDDPES